MAPLDATADVTALIKPRLGFAPEERKRYGVIRHRPVTSNIGLHRMLQHSRLGMIRKAHLKARSETLTQEVRPRPFDVTRGIGSFSGGNPQKPSTGRGLAADTRMVLFDDPAHGIDVGPRRKTMTRSQVGPAQAAPSSWCRPNCPR